jgi:hypothetical protein
MRAVNYSYYPFHLDCRDLVISIFTDMIDEEFYCVAVSIVGFIVPILSRTELMR